MAKKEVEAGNDIQQQVLDALNIALQCAEQINANVDSGTQGLSDRIFHALAEMSRLSQKASTGFTNIVTCLAIKAAMPNIDIRYHQVQIQHQTDRGAGFNFRGISEKLVYPWLNTQAFEGAKSGWQTRTFERPKPYMLDYDENIGDIKNAFLTIFDEIEVYGQSATQALAHLMYLQWLHRESKQISLSLPKTQDISLIINLLSKHFFYPYKTSRGASRLPVLALYAVYEVMLGQLERYKGMMLKPLEAHSAADSQTGAIGDIEIIRADNAHVFEAIEVKHGIALNERIIHDAANKIMDKSIDRYYILTTHASCEPDASLVHKIAAIKALHHCQLIANGVIPSLKYYLRLLADPSHVLPKYVALLSTDKSIKHEHREIWNKISIE